MQGSRRRRRGFGPGCGCWGSECIVYKLYMSPQALTYASLDLICAWSALEGVMRIVRSDGSVIEGTPSEIAEFESFQRFRNPPGSPRDALSSEGSKQPIAASSSEDWEFASADVAFLCLTRRKLSKQLRSAIQMIYAGGADWVSATDIQKHVGYSTAQFAGMMGAFGRRFINTRGYVLNSSFFEQEWDEDLSCYIYRLPSTVQTAVEKARIVD